jgi:GDP-L-fucose synthase
MKKIKIFIAGENGLVSSSLAKVLSQNPNFEVLAFGRRTIDYLDRQKTFEFVKSHKPNWLLLSAAHVGGIHANQTNPLSFISTNLQIQTNLIDASINASIENVIFFGSSCIYPRNAEQPIKEESLMGGQLEDTNKAYAMAKIAGVFHINAIREELNLNYFTVMPTNLYGENDNFDEITGHVFPSLISKFTSAKSRGEKKVELWGDGSPLREFLHTDDLSRAVQTLISNGKSNYDILNIGAGRDITIASLAKKIAQEANFEGEIAWNRDKPNGTPRKLLDISRISSLGWEPEISLETGIRATLKYFLNNRDFNNG